jgi:Xaa-Pro aminopeptidase
MQTAEVIPTGRRRKLAAAAARAGVEALLITHPPDVRYLTGFTGSNAAVLLKGSRATFITDGRYTTQAQAEVDGAKVLVAEKPVAVAACELAAEQGVASLGFDARHTSVEALATLTKAAPAGLKGAARKAWLKPVSGLVAEQREIKDEIEQEKMRAAAQLGCALFDQVLEHIVPGATEMEVAMALEYMARLAGVERMSFEAIVAGGERSALPHGRATLAKLPKRGFVVLDFGVVLDGYCSDMTRTLHMGKARPGEREVYDAVLDAQLAGIAAVKAGVTGAEVDEATRSVLQAAGFGDSFTHSTGHGVGLEIHESPRLGKRMPNVESPPLKAGMIVTIEPGAYLPGRFGIRIEDTVLVTKTGCEILTPTTKAWFEL